MIEWLVPVGGFWLVSVAYLGSMPTEIEGGSGPRHVIALVLIYALFLGVWAALRAALGGMGFVGRMILPSVLAVALYPLVAWLGFKAVGVRLRWGGGAAHH